MRVHQSSPAEELRVAVGNSSLGMVLIAETAKGIRAIQIGDDREALRRELRDRFPSESMTEPDASTNAMLEKVIAIVESPTTNVDLPLDIRGTEFQRKVWQALRDIPPGSTESYTEVANRIGQPKSVRAVAHACAENALAVIVPCHRVLRSDGSLAGYRWGVERKRILLEREAATHSA